MWSTKGGFKKKKKGKKRQRRIFLTKSFPLSGHNESLARGLIIAGHCRIRSWPCHNIASYRSQHKLLTESLKKKMAESQERSQATMKRLGIACLSWRVRLFSASGLFLQWHGGCKGGGTSNNIVHIIHESWPCNYGKRCREYSKRNGNEGFFN